jgi:DNA-binding NarL/FixJ family response regulator
MLEVNQVIDTILIVDDEQSVRKTFQEWLEGARLNCRILTAADAESALQQANRGAIDLAILDWNLGAGHDGLRLLEDLYVFNPDVVAIMITGYAHQATPLDAMRMGVRDYLDKNQDLGRDTFLKAVRRQLERIRPVKRERQLHCALLAFRDSIDKLLPMIQSAAALTDPVSIPDAMRSLFQLLLRLTHAQDGVLLARSFTPDSRPAENYRAYSKDGQPLSVTLVPFEQSIAAAVLSMQQPSTMTNLEEFAAAAAMKLQEFEAGRRSILAIPLSIAPGTQVVLEVFNKIGADNRLDNDGFTEGDRQLAAAAADLGTDLLRHALAERRTFQMLGDTLAAARKAGESVALGLHDSSQQTLGQPAATEVLERLQERLMTTGASQADVQDTVGLADAIRALAQRHGRPALRQCTELVNAVGRLLDEVTGSS